MAGINPVGGNSQDSEKPDFKPGFQNQSMKESLFLKLDKNKDGKISYQELVDAGYEGEDLVTKEEALFRAERNVIKWFSYDRNGNGTTDNVERYDMWELHNSDEPHKMDNMTSEEFARKNNLKFSDEIYDTFEEWCKCWIEDENPMCGIKASIKERLGKDLTPEEEQMLYDAMKNEANRMLFKSDLLYNRLNSTSYTRLVTDDQIVSCCGGDISKPPVGPQNSEKACTLIFSEIGDEKSVNDAGEVKNRLAWAAFRTLPEDEVKKMSASEYEAYQQEWQKVRNMKASDYRELLKPENSLEIEQFESSSIMTVKQIVDYIDIVESVTGKDFDSDDWSVNGIEFLNIVEKVNGTYGDEDVLKGKTRADIPPQRQDWLKYLEEQGLLLDQFKE